MFNSLLHAALECFELGRVAYNQDDQYHARLWITEAYRRYQNESKTGKVPDLDEPLLLDYLAFSSFKVSVKGGGEKKKKFHYTS